MGNLAIRIHSMLVIYTVINLLLVKTHGLTHTSKGIFTRNETCEAIRYKQNIEVDGYKIVKIDNHYCEGQCTSGYVPYAPNGEKQYRYSCSSCQPSTTVRKPVTLESIDGKRKIIVDVELFMGCKCMQSKCQKSDYNFAHFGTKTLSPKSESELKKYPCRNICRKCRKMKREYKSLLQKKEKMEFMKSTCVLDNCKDKISEEVFAKAKIQKQFKKASCKECKLCKKRKREHTNL